ncbi:MAG: endonuclease/exonuclease/phosphatase family protein [Verrucomicrobiae bacterium]|nr:endonuclease/exonuclease/phosphatase family protein [Verrucomicrobiae bacterium]
MTAWRKLSWYCIGGLCFLLLVRGNPATFTVATYNVENYLHVSTATREAKSEASKAKVRESIRAMSADVLALQEIGATNALFELRDSLKSEGLYYPYWEHVGGFDTNIFVAVLSRFPIVSRSPITNASFIVGGRRFTISRGFAQVDIQVNRNYRFTLITAHLKSRRAIADADESELRAREAKILRQRIDSLLNSNPGLNLVVLGDFNDSKASLPVKTLIGRGRNSLIDTRPAEKTGAHEGYATRDDYASLRRVTWTHFYAKEDIYQRADYILISRGMAREWDPTGTYVLALPDWGLASDHRPIVARFFTEDR